MHIQIKNKVIEKMNKKKLIKILLHIYLNYDDDDSMTTIHNYKNSVACTIAHLKT